MKKIIITTICILILGSIIYSSSNSHKNPTGNKDESTKKQEVTIAMVTFPGYGPLFLAKDKGFFTDVDVNLETIESLGDIRAAVNSGNADAYIATYDMYQSIKGQKPSGIGFLVVDESHGGDGIVVSKNINSIKDFKGKKVGAEPGFPPYLILQYMLNKEGMTLKDIDFKDLPTTDAGIAFVANKLDAAAIFEPSLSASSKARSDSKILVTSSDPEIKGLVQDILFANETFIKEHPEALTKVVEGYFKALEYIKTNPEDAYTIMAKHFNVSPAEMKDFTSGISWISKEENTSIFNKNSNVNVYKTFTLVGDLLEKNEETDVRVNSYEKLTDSILKNTK
ncbi:MAG: ABC transporter substrate-binding protein [Candidatus Pacebacteria bacterium]|nr:ABC transporter substrate-binding protein [Candidatus Paceibacterota bacterium]